MGIPAKHLYYFFVKHEEGIDFFAADVLEAKEVVAGQLVFNSGTEIIDAEGVTSLQHASPVSQEITASLLRPCVRQGYTKQEIYQKQDVVVLILNTGAAAATPVIFVTVPADSHHTEMVHRFPRFGRPSLEGGTQFDYGWDKKKLFSPGIVKIVCPSDLFLDGKRLLRLVRNRTHG